MILTEVEDSKSPSTLNLKAKPNAFSAARGIQGAKDAKHVFLTAIFRHDGAEAIEA